MTFDKGSRLQRHSVTLYKKLSTACWILFFNLVLTLGDDLFTYLFFPFIFISWRLITLHYCSGFCHTLTWISHGFTCVPHPDPPLPPLSPSHPSGSSQCTSPEHLSHASNLGWWSVPPLIVYLFQCCSLRASRGWFRRYWLLFLLLLVYFPFVVV